MNVGLHYIQAAQGFNSYGKYVVNIPSYKPRVFDDKSAAFLSQADEDFCYTKKVYLQHWAIADLPSEFVIPAKNSWDIHKFNFVNGNKTFNVLAESRRTPQIIIFEPYCVGTLFNVSKRYAITVSILKNFILSKLKELKGMPNKNRGMGVGKISEEFRATTNGFFNFNTESENLQTGRKPGRGTVSSLKNITTTLDRVSTANSTASRPRTAKLLHSGFALARHDEGNLIVENNTVRADFTIKLVKDNKPGSLKNLFDSQGALRKKTGIHDIDTNFESSKFVLSNVRSQFPATTSSEHFAFQSYFRSTGNPNQETKTTNSKRSPAESFQGYRNKSNMQIDIEEEAQKVQKNKAEIARMLYPDIPRDAVKEEELWVENLFL